VLAGKRWTNAQLKHNLLAAIERSHESQLPKGCQAIKGKIIIWWSPCDQ
jgi:hypothetical protein